MPIGMVVCVPLECSADDLNKFINSTDSIRASEAARIFASKDLISDNGLKL